ncbi:hypothetical protein [Roseateles sp.]|uniref:hypothetical protein n=1 Tax=Roseateles sp. TaxID=1971397 RepID=UPI0031D2DE56
MKSIYLAGLVSLVLLVACGGSPARRDALDAQQAQRQRAMAMWKARCEKSGVFVHKTVSNVEGIYLINVRLRSNFGDSEEEQYALDDPYGHDSTGDLYIHNFLRGFHHHPKGKPSPYKSLS